MITIKEKPLQTKEQTGFEMHRLIKNYYRDLLPFKNYSLIEFFNLVKNLKYKRDTKAAEIVSRPKYLFALTEIRGIDCKKKSILICSYARIKNIQYRLIACSQRPDKRVHHVFPQLKIKGAWINADATYSKYMLGQQKILTKWSELKCQI